MLKIEVTIRNATGFHIRPAQLFTEQAAKFQSQVNVLVKEQGVKVDGKSILGLMTLGLAQGNVIEISAEGPDEEKALETLVQLVEGGFGEV
ncbi:HPr family phosphocarrier protein [Paenibacillus sp. PL91]|uniref:HPr family phosphocarrier protein n=1 Tax=Paenibacillus sp. PL91 TaxID=2729538 RepID=UPI00145D266B|nr:HPr family phosphocarrier protein [Paenibacillus sp. PL91]MBC9201059.1 HPr family phosphocarrier protein [Paenibacillus sp. PL91]